MVRHSLGRRTSICLGISRGHEGRGAVAEMNSTNVLRNLRRGGFATVPPQIAARCITRNVPATLLCFPSCVPYVSVRRGLTSDIRRTYVAAYYPVFDSARFSAGSVQLSYRWLHASPFSVHVLRETNSSRWHVFKCRGSQLLSHVVGDGYGEAMIRATILGLSDREPAFAYGATLATFDEIREENLAQIALAEGRQLDDDEFSQHNSEDEQTESTLSPSKQTLVFGQIQKAAQAVLVFIPEADAVRLAAIHRAIATAVTWGDFFDAVPSDELDTVYDRVIDEDGEHLPDRSAKFDPDLLGVCEGDYPDWPEQQMLDWLPAHICREFGRVESSALNGAFLSLDVRRAPEILAALERAGFECRLDEELVRRACGN
jgi:hypothetical protein